MYETFFGLNRRPFLATPDGSCFAATDSNQEALDALIVCAESGQGIGILTSDPGLGKTALCQRLAQEMAGPFQTVYLGNCNFAAHQSLLQAILYELGHPYSRMPEDELRLELRTAVKSVRPEKQGVVLVFDEAHLLQEELLEEIRTLADLSEDAQPLIRVVLSGQLALEETLIGPELDALNQRVRCHVTLSPLTQMESAMYLAHRLHWAGGEIDKVFTPEAIRLIAHSGDGNPRCLNQLADHSLLLGYVAEAHLVDETIVRDALNDMRQLPLQMNEPAYEQPATATDQEQQSDGRSADDEYDQSHQFVDSNSIETEDELSALVDSHFDQPSSEIATFEPFGEGVTSEEPNQNSIAFEVGAEIDLHPPTESNELPEFEQTIDDSNQSESDAPVEPIAEESSEIVAQTEETGEFEESNDSRIEAKFEEAVDFEEEIVFDRYAAIDDGQSVPDTAGIVWELTSRDDVKISTDSSPAYSESQADQLNGNEPSEETPVEAADVDSSEFDDFESADTVIEHETTDDEADSLDDAATGEFIASEESTPFEALESQSPVESNEHNSDADSVIDAETEINPFRVPSPNEIIDTVIHVLDNSEDGWIYPRQHLTDLAALTSSGQEGLENLGLPDDDSNIDFERVADTTGESESIEEQVGSDVLDLCLETQHSILERMDELQAVDEDLLHEGIEFLQEYDVIEPEPDESQSHNEREMLCEPDDFTGRDGEQIPDGISDGRTDALSSGNRPYGRLFSELRRRQRQ